MTQHYSSPERANEAGALPDVETFHIAAYTPFTDCPRCDQKRPDFNGHGYLHVGWYYDPTPGKSVGEFVGPFATEAEAVADARIDAEVDIQAEEIINRQFPGCHPDCGPVVKRREGEHAHEDADGICWHEDEDDEQPPLCVRAMGCLCAGHAAGYPASAACDTDEQRAREYADAHADATDDEGAVQS